MRFEPPAALAALERSADEPALEAAAAAVTERIDALIAALVERHGGEGFWRDRMWRTVEVVHGARAIARITDVDEVYRIWEIAERLAAGANQGAGGLTAAIMADVVALHDDLLFEVEPATPAREPLPGSPISDALLQHGSFKPIDRVAEALAAWEEAIATEADPAALDERFAINRGEHGRSLALIEWAAASGTISPGERDRLVEALGTYRGRGGWPEGTPTALKGAVQEMLGALHALFSARQGR